MTQELNNKIGDTLSLIHEVCDELIRYKAKLAAARELLEGQFAEDLYRQTGIPVERCRELLEIIRA